MGGAAGTAMARPLFAAASARSASAVKSWRDESLGDESVERSGLLQRNQPSDSVSMVGDRDLGSVAHLREIAAEVISQLSDASFHDAKSGASREETRTAHRGTDALGDQRETVRRLGLAPEGPSCRSPCEITDVIADVRPGCRHCLLNHVYTVYMNDTREQLVAAARAHLDTHGLEGLTLRQVARAVGVSHGAPLRHFSGLSSMLSAVTADAFDELVATVSRHVDVADGPLARLRGAGQGYVEFAVANPGPYELMFRPERLDRTDAAYLRASLAAFDQLATLTAAAQAAGWRTDTDSTVLTGVLWAGVHGIASLWNQGSLPIATNTDELDRFVSVFQIDLAGLPAI